MTKHDFGIFRVQHDGKYSIIYPGDWANVIALTPTGNIVLVKQLRIGSGEVGIELPGGKIDPGESPADAVARELFEETGFKGDAPQTLSVVRPNPAIMNNRMHYFVIENAMFVGPQNLDEGEDIEVVLVSYEKIWELVRSGEINHALTIAALGIHKCQNH